MTNREKFLRERRRADELELQLINLHQRSSEANAQLGELARQNERLREACAPLVGWRQELAEAQRDLALANDRNGALSALIERLTYVADIHDAAEVTGNDSLGNLPASALAIDPVRWAELMESHATAYATWKAERE